jgi:hypothetical protein
MVNILENAMMENRPFPLPLKILLTKLIIRDVTSNKETVMFNQQSLLLSIHVRGSYI